MQVNAVIMGSHHLKVRLPNGRSRKERDRAETRSVQILGVLQSLRVCYVTCAVSTPNFISKCSAQEAQHLW